MTNEKMENNDAAGWEVLDHDLEAAIAANADAVLQELERQIAARRAALLGRTAEPEGETDGG